MNLNSLLRVLCSIFLFCFYLERYLNSYLYFSFRGEVFSGAHEFFNILLLMSLCLGMVTAKRLFFFSTFICNTILFDTVSPLIYGADLFCVHLTLFLSLIKLDNQEYDELSRVGLFTLFFHMLIIYSFNGISKFNDDVWLSGEIVQTYLVKQTNFFSLLSSELLIYVDRGISYFVMALQPLYALAFFPRFRRKVLFLFICKHISIAVLIHPFFGLVCALLNLILFSYKGPLITKSTA